MSQIFSKQGGANSDGGVKRTRLREFQTQLVERMQAAQRGGLAITNQLGILIGQQRYLLDLREAGEIVSLSGLTEVPLTQDWYVGLANIRGNLTSVVDLPRLLGKERLQQDSSCRIVAFAPALAFNGGLLVSQVLGLRHIQDMQETEQGDPAEQRPWLPRSYLDRDGQVWHVLSLTALVQDAEFLHIGR